MAQEVYHHTFSNGLTLLAERMEDVRSAALNFLIPAGCIYDPPEYLGMASVLSEWLTRGAGDRDSRQLSLDMDNLGLDRSESAGAIHMHLWGATLAKNLPAALDLYADVIRRPHFPEEELPYVQALALQDIKSLEDDPRRKTLLELRRRHYPEPLGRDARGTLDTVQALTPAAIRDQFERYFQPRGTILSVAGNIDWDVLRDQVEKLFGDWPAQEKPTYSMEDPPGGYSHLEKDTAQTQIALAYPSVPFGHEDYYKAMGAVNVLSGGMSGRLFTEVREKHGLVYGVSASYQAILQMASIVCYAGTTTEKAQQTLDVLVGELRRLDAGIEQDEVDRVKAGLKSSLIMQQESTSARAGRLATDWFYLHRVRSLDEVQAAVERLTPEIICDYARRYPPTEFTLVTLGKNALEIP